MTTEHPHHLVHVTRIPVRWGDMDALGHVNNTVYFRYAEGAAKIVWWNPKTGKSLPLPDFIRRMYPHD